METSLNMTIWDFLWTQMLFCVLRWRRKIMLYDVSFAISKMLFLELFAI